MPKKPGKNNTKRINISTTPQVMAYLEELVDLGFHGSTTTEVAGRFVEGAIERLIREGILEIKGAQPKKR